MKRTLFVILASGLVLSACSDEKELILPEDEPIQNVEPSKPVTHENSCNANETACDGYTLLTCGEDGKFVASACSKGEICVEVNDKHECMTPEKYDEIMHPVTTKDCEADQTKCDDVGKRYTCDEDGNWVVAEDCIAKGADCKMEAGVAICKETTIVEPEPVKECTEGESRCNGDFIQICNESGKFENSQNCAEDAENPQVCQIDNKAASCIASCTAGSTRCHNDVLETCVESEDGNHFEMTVCDDPENQICSLVEGNAQCIDKPAEPDCKADEVSCAEDGRINKCVDGQWVPEDCGGGQACMIIAGTATCSEKRCETGETKCGERNVLLTCHEGEWSETNCIRDKKICSPDGVGGKAGCIAINSGEGGDVTEYMDTDGDTIPDKMEGRESNRDTDKDGIPDYLDFDSDNDTIPDVVEAWNGEPPTSVSNYYNRDKTLPPDDSDYDGVPNYIDEDSDDNGILDKNEACPGKVAACQIQSMAAGKDADGKDLSTKFDAVMMPLDTDNNKTADYIDYDNDGDSFSDIEEINGLVATDPAPAAGHYSGNCQGKSNIGTPATPLNCKAGTPADYMNTDSDGDGLSDVIEGRMMKGNYFARYSDDIDNDGIKDYDECVDYKTKKLGSSCRDSDGDGVPDMLETDSDGDGIPDSIEVVLGSNPTNTNSDGDDAPDIVEYAICQMENGTDCKDISSTTGKAKCKCATMNDKNDSPTTRGDFVFTTPFKKASTPNKQTLSLETSIQTIDLFFLFDSTSSMSDELASLKTSLPTIIHELHCDDLGRACTENNDCKGLTNAICSEKGRCITNPSTGCFDNMYTGLGGYNTIHTLFISQALDPDVEKTITAINNFSWRGDYEAPYSGVICTALKKGEDNTLCAHTTNTCNTSSDRIGCTGFRKDAIRVLLHAFDENQCYSYWSPGTTNYQNYKPKCETVKANVGTVLKNKKIRYVGLWSPSWEPTAVSHFDDGWTNDLVAEYIGINSGSVNTATPPVPFVYKAKDSDLANKAKSGILEIAQNMPMNITADVEDFDQTDNLNASQLISKLVVNLEDGKVAQNRRCTKITNTIDKTTNPKYEGVKDLLPGNTLCYDVIPVQNQSLFPADKVIPKIYKARVKVIGDGSVLNSGVAYFVVPPELEGSNE